MRGSVPLARYGAIRVNTHYGHVVITFGRYVYALVIRKVPK